MMGDRVKTSEKPNYLVHISANITAVNCRYIELYISLFSFYVVCIVTVSVKINQELLSSSRYITCLCSWCSHMQCSFMLQTHCRSVG